MPPSSRRRAVERNNPANTSPAKRCDEHDGHKHVMYRHKSPYGGRQGLKLTMCHGCGILDQTDWYECIHCIKKRCHQCKVRPKESDSYTQFVDGLAPATPPAPEYP